MEEFDSLQEFIDINTKQTPYDKIICKFCDKKFSYDSITKHFINKHEKEYLKSDFADDVPWKEAISTNKKIENKLEKEFMKTFSMPMDDMDEEEIFSSFLGQKGNSGSMEEIFMEMMMNGSGGKSKSKKTKKKK